MKVIQRLILSVPVLTLLGGCAQMNAYMEKAAKEQAEKDRAALIETHLKENDGAEVKGEFTKLVMGSENMLKARGYTVKEVRVARGAGGNGMMLAAQKTAYTDLGSAVASNVIGNMLGADRGKITKAKVEATNVFISRKWNPDGMTEDKGKLVVFVNGYRWNINQNDEKTDQAEMDMSETGGLRDDIAKNFRP